MIRRCVWTCLLFLFAGPLHADYEKGLRALEKQDDRKAAEEFLAVARSGDHRAMMALAAMYAGGRGVAKDYAEALRWYKEAARYGRSDATYRVGLIYEGGYGVRKNPREAARLFLDSAKLGYVEAHLKVATLYRDGGVVEQNPARAYAWYTLAAQGGKAEAQQELAKLTTALSAEELAAAEQIAREYAAQYLSKE